jgi:hypothetical protein
MRLLEAGCIDVVSAPKENARWRWAGSDEYRGLVRDHELPAGTKVGGRG